MQSLLRNDMLQPDLGAILNVLHGHLSPIERCRAGFRGSVENEPVVVFVSVGVECDLLLCGTVLVRRSGVTLERGLTHASGWIRVGVRVEVSALRVDVSNRNSRTVRDIYIPPISHQLYPTTLLLTRIRILHPMSNQRMLKLGTHEPISLPTPVQDPKVNLKHEHVKQHWHHDQAQRAGREMPQPRTRGDT